MQKIERNKERKKERKGMSGTGVEKVGTKSFLNSLSDQPVVLFGGIPGSFLGVGTGYSE